MTPASAGIEPAHDVLHQTTSHPLDPIFAARTVAVIGASETPGSLGQTLMRNLSSAKAKIFPVNPKRSSVLGVKAYPNVGAVPEPPDLAVIVTPAQTVPGVMSECADAGVKGAVIISAGFKECGAPGVELEQQVLAQARRGKMRVIGPNCLGVMLPHASFNATFASAQALPGSVAFLSQSGALCTAVLDWSFRENVGFSAFISVGSMLDVNWGDLIYYFGDDPRTKSIVMYMESIGDARSFLSAAREVALTKPIIVIKVGHTEAAAKAAASHTGSLTGSDQVLDAAFRRVGVLRVDTIAELFDMAEVLSKQPRPKGPRLAIVTNAGGPGVLATDMLISSGSQLAELSQETFAGLQELLPAHWSRNNPVDILGDADPQRYAKAVEIVAKDPANDGLLVILTPQAMTDPGGTAEQLKPYAKLGQKPIIASWMGGPEVEPGVAILNGCNIPTFAYPDRAARAFHYMWRYSENLRSLYETPTLTPESEETRPDREIVEAILQSARTAKRTILTEVESKEILAAYGIPTVATRLARSPEEAVELAANIGYPVVLKLYSETITHKTDVGGVQLNLHNASDVKRAWRAIETAVKEKAGESHFSGVTVQPMVTEWGTEVILGSSTDPQFGPVLLFGAGGQLVEIFKDRALALPPLNATLARRMMEQTRIYSVLQGARGRKAADLAAIERLLVRFSCLVAEQPWIKEIDINPLLASSERIVALDARVVVHDAAVTEDKLPKLAIRPYPNRYVTPWKLKDGTSVTIRPIRPEDEPLLIKFHQTLSERSVYNRYFSQLKLSQRTAHERLIRICHNDYDREIALVAEFKPPKKREREILGVGRLSKIHGVGEAEFAVVVSDQWQGRGLGSQLLNLLIQVGRHEKLSCIKGTVLAENREMQRLCKKLGFQIHHELGESECEVEIAL
ncbi:MAG: bifunctional acetate--CoA ligase family protein/GNAT family N-acetyltransferase [Verrucomicrobia bacterium]|nr:bifunctional acetate--CoA ligase family protein/GNAT family N-acetyltransferase [Verrucomicrobiota bacterium]